ncbi:MAG: hypothetical protein R3B45_05690 [Bdellovibrionota bacterium]
MATIGILLPKRKMPLRNRPNIPRNNPSSIHGKIQCSAFAVAGITTIRAINHWAIKIQMAIGIVAGAVHLDALGISAKIGKIKCHTNGE